MESPLRAKILIVDDDERNAFAAVQALEELDCELVVARSGAEALRHVLEDEFAVILLDLHMPGMDGYCLAENILAREQFRNIPIVAFSCYDLTRFKQRAMRSGMADFIPKLVGKSAFTGPDGQRVTIFGEGGGQLLADELDVPLIGKVPLSEELREAADAGTQLVLEQPNAPAAQAIRDAARGIVAATPQELPVMQAPPPAAMPEPALSGTELPVVQR